MGDTSAGHPSNNSGRYEIRISGHLGPRWATWFDGMTLTARSDGTTVLEGPVVDQAALHGLLRKLRDTGLPLLSIAQVDPSQVDPSQVDPAQVDTAQSTCPPPNPHNSHRGD